MGIVGVAVGVGVGVGVGGGVGGVGGGSAGSSGGGLVKLKSAPSRLRRNRTGVAHSISLTSVSTALRASATAASTGSWRPMSEVYSSSANVMAAPSEISNCIATTAGTPSLTSVVAMPAYGSVTLVRAPSHELSTASRSVC